mmetsp:Transcript_89414/g.278218  ORF Transcript_89414/g.278218 Transcript_89414/m.278218 type:complete len:514 (-) Transcript_89414:99-1640(-)
MAGMPKTGGVPMLECDYLVVGAGARGLAFVDAMLQRVKNAKGTVKVAIVDDRDEPGGHWNDAYRFAKLHRQSAHYGVSSKPLEKARNGGKHGHFASTNELLSYYGDVMDALVDSGCVEFFPMCSFRNNQVESLVNPDLVWKIPASCKVVESGLARIQVPSTQAPPFEVGLGAFVVTPNYLTSVLVPPTDYCVIGAGRTAIDVIIWLLSKDVDPKKIRWIMPRDHWYQCREAILGKNQLKTASAWSAEVSKDHGSLWALLERCEKVGLFCRLDRSRRPECCHGATVSKEEFVQLRKVKDIVRLGHVRAVHKDHLLMDHGTVPVAEGTLHIDCTSSWVQKAPKPVPIWQGTQIFLQPIQEVFTGAGEFNVCLSAALVGLIEALIKDDGVKNSMCTAGRHPDTIQDWIRLHIAGLENNKLRMHPHVRAWLSMDRLSLYSALDPQDLGRGTSAMPGWEKKAIAILTAMLEDGAEPEKDTSPPSPFKDTSPPTSPRESAAATEPSTADSTPRGSSGHA